MDRSVSAVMLVVGVFLGVLVGRAYAGARGSWREYAAAKAALPGLRKGAWGLRRALFTRGGLVALLCVAAMGWAALGK